uniref:Uncharacterized protein n=1 Tax=Calidris pygmaea TaxID=425635 RepID=A0A8C3KQ37_9CHAR
MTLEERRKEYLRDYVALKSIPTWMEDLKSKSESDGENAKEDLQGKRSLSEKVSLYRGDITVLEVDAIVNADVTKLLCFWEQEEELKTGWTFCLLFCSWFIPHYGSSWL